MSVLTQLTVPGEAVKNRPRGDLYD